jgi:hypothetical protein
VLNVARGRGVRQRHPGNRNGLGDGHGQIDCAEEPAWRALSRRTVYLRLLVKGVDASSSGCLQSSLAVEVG